MNADERRFKYEDLTQRIIGVFFEVYSEQVALLLNFGPKPQVKRLAFANERKRLAHWPPRQTQEVPTKRVLSALICVHLRRYRLRLSLCDNRRVSGLTETRHKLVYVQ